MTLAEAKAKLSTMEGGQELLAAFDGELSTVRAEAGSHRVKAKEASDKFAALAKHLGIDPSTTDLETALAEVSKERPQPGTLKALEAQIAALTNTVEAERKTKAEEVGKRRSLLGRQSVLEALGKENALSPEDLAVILTPNVVVGEDDKPQWKNADGTISDVSAGVKAWLTGKPHFIKSNQQQGPGGPRSPSARPGVATITRAEFDAKVASKDPTVYALIASNKLTVVD